MNDASGLTAAAPQSPVLAMTLRRAAAYAQQRSHRYVTLEHLVLALTDDQDAILVLRSVNPDIEPLRTRAGDVVNRFLSTLYTPGNTELRPSYKLDRILQVAASDAAKSPYGEVDGAFVIAALTAESDSVAAGLLRQHGLGFSQAMGWIYTNRSGRRPAPAHQSRPREAAPQPRSAPDSRRPPVNHSRADAPHARPDGRGNEPKLEDMLSSARQMLEREERGPRPNGASQGQYSGAAPPTENSFNAIAFAPASQPGAAPRRERTLSAALENVRPAVAPAPPPKSSNARALVVSKSSGKLSENVPRKMRKGAATPVEVRISREETMALFRNFQGKGAQDTPDVIITRAMTVTLKAPDGGFIIETQSPETQWIFDRPSFLETERFGRWRWTVTPSVSGKRRLQLVASARSIDDNGMADDMVTPDQVIEVRVRGNYGRGFRKLLLWIFLIITGGVLAETALRFGPFLLN